MRLAVAPCLIVAASAATSHGFPPIHVPAATTVTRPDPEAERKAKAERDAKEIAEKAKPIGKAGATIAGFGLVTVLILGAISFVMQLVPIIIAFVRNHPSKLAITALSLLLGWTCIGWFVALIWSLTGTGGGVHVRYDDRPRRRR